MGELLRNGRHQRDAAPDIRLTRPSRTRPPPSPREHQPHAPPTQIRGSINAARLTNALHISGSWLRPARLFSPSRRVLRIGAHRPTDGRLWITDERMRDASRTRRPPSRVKGYWKRSGLASRTKSIHVRDSCAVSVPPTLVAIWPACHVISRREPVERALFPVVFQSYSTI
jgi:hypothetical protein